MYFPKPKEEETLEEYEKRLDNFYLNELETYKRNILKQQKKKIKAYSIFIGVGIVILIIEWIFIIKALYD